MTLRYLLIVLGLVLFGSTTALLAYDVYLSAQLRRLLSRPSAKDSGISWAAHRAARPQRLLLAARSTERGIRR